MRSYGWLGMVAVVAGASPVLAGPMVGAASPPAVWNDEDAVLTVRGAGLDLVTEVRLVEVGGAATVSLTRFVGPRGADRADVVVPAGTPRGEFDVVAVDASGASPAGAARLVVLNRALPEVAGDHPVGFVDDRMRGASGDRVAVRIYYPAASAGQVAPVDPRGGRFAAVVWCHAFKPFLFAAGVDHRRNAWIASWLASFGYVVICPDLAPNNVYWAPFSDRDTGQSNAERDAADALAALDHLEALDADPTSALFGRVDTTRAALGGHSRGGDGALIAAAREVAARGAAARVRAVVALSPPSLDARDRGRPLRFGDLTALPVLLMGGSEDRIAPFDQQRSILAGAGAGSAALELLGANHSQFKDTADRIKTDGRAALSLADQHAAGRRYVTAWLNLHVRDELRVAPTHGAAAARQDPRVRSVDTR